MALGYLLVALVAAAVTLFSLQNSDQTSVKFLVWTLDGVPVGGLALASLALGLVAAALPLWVRAWRWRSRARSAEVKIAALEKTLAERDQELRHRPRPGELPSSLPRPPDPPTAQSR